MACPWLLFGRPPAFGLTAAYAITLGIGGAAPAGGRGRVVPKPVTMEVSTVADTQNDAGSGSDGSASESMVPAAMVLEASDSPPTIVSEDTVVAVVMDRLDALSVSRAANGEDIRAPEGVRI